MLDKGPTAAAEIEAEVIVAESRWLEPADLCLATSMTCTTTQDLTEAEPWTTQHWSRAEWLRANGRHPRYKTAADPSENFGGVAGASAALPTHWASQRNADPHLESAGPVLAESLNELIFRLNVLAG